MDRETTGPQEAGPQDDVVTARETVVSYVVRPEALGIRAPADVPEGCYVARFDEGSVGNPSFALLPYTDGAPALMVTVAGDHGVDERSPRYVRVATRVGEVDYELHLPVNATGWASPPPDGPA
ncbi:hypothetical protein [Xylanimonas protaetiae]|uniref:Uncharacterized protein n=1 Tax=Xylanimonas protaetiae TaxID=2509457 RepID=A0A4P6F1I4_9MICO|nr:hypothetical protein [Xylanimonas protaetiae]QAY69086.1 hypothetical protein ET471_02685 [Xylanimonas protaetiae]